MVCTVDPGRAVLRVRAAGRLPVSDAVDSGRLPLGDSYTPKNRLMKDRHVHGIASGPTLFAQVQQHARERPHHVAVWNRLPGGQYEATSYSELAAAPRSFAHAFANSFHEARFRPLCLARSPICIAAMLGALGAGKAFICLHQKLRLRQVSDILEAARAQVVLVDTAGLM